MLLSDVCNELGVALDCHKWNNYNIFALHILYFVCLWFIPHHTLTLTKLQNHEIYNIMCAYAGKHACAWVCVCQIITDCRILTEHNCYLT
jgi:hypothetical protein